jgi:SAM-dependent methyltransferase
MMSRIQDESSHARTVARFDSCEAASKYAGRDLDKRRRREQHCIRTALADVSRGGRVLDLPCGTGSLTTSLADLGFQVTAADVSTHMLDRAEQAWALACADKPDRAGHARFVRQDIMHTDFPDGHFDAVVCNRLFHHFCEAETRRAALAELGRISRGPVIVFFFNRLALDTIRLAALRLVFGKFRRGRIPITIRRFAAEGAAAGLRLEKVLFTRRAVSPQCYAMFRPISSDPRL